MPDVKSYRNRLKLKDEPARKLAIMDLKRVPESDRDAATAVLLDHLPKETSQDIRQRILEILLLWKRVDIAPRLEELSASPDPALARDAGEALAYLRTLQ